MRLVERSSEGSTVCLVDWSPPNLLLSEVKDEIVVAHGGVSDDESRPTSRPTVHDSDTVPVFDVNDDRLRLNAITQHNKMNNRGIMIVQKKGFCTCVGYYNTKTQTRCNYPSNKRDQHDKKAFK